MCEHIIYDDLANISAPSVYKLASHWRKLFPSASFWVRMLYESRVPVPSSLDSLPDWKEAGNAVSWTSDKADALVSSWMCHVQLVGAKPTCIKSTVASFFFSCLVCSWTGKKINQWITANHSWNLPSTSLWRDDLSKLPSHGRWFTKSSLRTFCSWSANSGSVLLF